MSLPLPRIVLARFVEPAAAPWLYVAATLAAAIIPAFIIYRFIEAPLTVALQRLVEPRAKDEGTAAA